MTILLGRIGMGQMLLLHLLQDQFPTLMQAAEVLRLSSHVGSWRGYTDGG
jgi:hypothetical protein